MKTEYENREIGSTPKKRASTALVMIRILSTPIKEVKDKEGNVKSKIEYGYCIGSTYEVTQKEANNLKFCSEKV